MYKHFLLNLYNWLFPTQCVVCHKKNIGEVGTFCNICFSNVAFITEPSCIKCGKLFTTGFPANTLCNTCEQRGRIFDKARSLFLYNALVKRMIVQIKNMADNSILFACCKLLFQRYPSIILNSDAIVPVPSHWTRVLYRGFNPADMIAKGLSVLSKVPVNKALKRIRRTPYQHTKIKSERLLNIQNAFKYTGRNIKNKNMLLVDDVFTTGATLNECAKTLLQAGAQAVNCITIASTSADYIKGST